MQIGFKALEARFGIMLAQPLRVASVIGTARATRESPQGIENQYPAVYRPADTFAGHFEFGLKYEEIHLEFFSRLFVACGPQPLEEWCSAEPFGQYARRAGFFYEWLTGDRLDVSDLAGGTYIDAISDDAYLTRTKAVRERRWRINNNLPGTRFFCPIIRRSQALTQSLQFNPLEALTELDHLFGEDVLMRAAAWLTLKESRASFLIEQEADQTDRVKRFAHVMAQYCGKLDEPLGTEGLAVLQKGILGTGALRLGVRRSPVFVGQATIREDIVHYIGPHFLALGDMLAGLQAFEQSTRGRESLARAAAIAFGFVYLHPMSDGNGRIHRFLINDTLLRDQAIPAGVILPVSATITSVREFGHGYDRVLEVFSRPFMRRYDAAYRLEEMTEYEDGVRSNFVFDAYGDANAAWRYPDLTEHAIYTAQLVAHTIRHEMADEARVLVRFELAQQRIKEVLEMPDSDAVRMIRSIKENGWRISGKLVEEYPMLDDKARALRVVEAVQSAFEDREPLPIAVIR
ncbi:Fic family protein [Achromobacter xylosoxidans]|uniref:Fic family protein n=3 Tax=Alcaligenes xylosoxydans xylosoxydans TaxID=85698 RepID=UPI0006AC17C2|nr:Fic family protein [Achromobacter xylosoxidans]KOQ22737.1 cell division protein Fic [Achromobacter xylosoxidans]KOQ28861.1 cell division protein Fic [Achromobacter xylosoxidans]KOQ31714.1 cell division protein Fic [Achromobacter xylosoxidans]KOQ38795.1 cell division protein Fic [Achromobacter xylosoxidans]KOQ42394.1 cell division protein Fic [Achromobacter xylosoxidans]